MTRQRILLPALLVLLLGGGSTVSADDDGWPGWTERWLFNPQERTRRAMEAMGRGEAEAALEPLETALRLEGESTEAVYNVGTARLATGAADSQGLLQSAAEYGKGPIVPSAHYNLGNARFAADELPAAIAAYKQALRLDPDFEDAKHNLELAQRLLEEQEEEQDQQDDEQQDDQQDQSEQQQDQEQEQEQQDQQPEPGGEPQQPQQQQQQQQSPLPQFRDLPDMTAEEAAAILEAVENMERERRRQEALERAQANVRGKKDW